MLFYVQPSLIGFSYLQPLVLSLPQPPVSQPGLFSLPNIPASFAPGLSVQPQFEFVPFG
jgi:hypothetical protein